MNTSKCPCCDQAFGDDKNLHIRSPQHKFHYYIWVYENKRKSLCKDREGIRIEINSANRETNLDFSFNKNKGQCMVEIDANQLEACNNKLTFNCCIFNDRREDDMFLTAANILDATPWSKLYVNDEDWSETDDIIEIKPKSFFKKIIIEFEIQKLILSSFKIPIGIECQTEDGKVHLTFCRTILIKIVLSIDNLLEDKQDDYKSPYTRQEWDKDLKEIKKPSSLKYQLNNYPIPREISKYLRYGLCEWPGMTIEEYGILHKLRSDMDPGYVTKENYKTFFHYCLWMEEAVQVMMLRSFNMESVKMEICGKNALKLEVPGLAEKRPSLIPGDLIRIRICNDHTGYDGYIKIVEDRHILIDKIDLELVEFVRENTDIDLDVAFQLGRIPLERAHEGIETVFNRGQQSLLFPDDLTFRNCAENFFLTNDDFINKSIIDNFEQRTAVQKILNETSQGAPYIVFGPPGTGKTVTIVETIWQILRKTQKTILVCAPANAACDMLASKLMLHCSKKELLRIHSETRERNSIPSEIIPYSNINKEDNRLDIFPVLVKNLKTYRVIVTTLILAGKYNKKGYNPDYVFIDEAAQALEPDTCIPIALLKFGGSIVLAGDPKQLGPIVMSKILQGYGYGKSMLERLMETQEIYKHGDTNFISMLKKNFRSNATILEIPNNLFYDGQLISASTRKDPISTVAVFPKIKNLHYSLKGAIKKTGEGQAVEFCAILSKERREGRSPSYFNPAEASMVKEYIKTLLEMDLGPIHSVKPSEIGVITPYIRQVYKIKNLLESSNIRNVEVGSTEAFQGREKRIIIISTVRAQHNLLKHDKKYNLGFVRQEKRFNVALTRSISKEIIIGCPSVLITDENWKKYINKCQDLNSYYGVPLQERTQDKIEKILNRFEKFPKMNKM